MNGFKELRQCLKEVASSNRSDQLNCSKSHGIPLDDVGLYSDYGEAWLTGQVNRFEAEEFDALEFVTIKLLLGLFHDQLSEEKT